MAKVELQAKVDTLNHEVEFLKVLFDAVRRLLLDRTLLPTLPTKGKFFPIGKMWYEWGLWTD